MEPIELSEHLPEFKRAALDYIRTALGMQQWIELRTFASREMPMAPGGIPTDRYTPETIIQQTESWCIAVNDVLTAVFKPKAEIIGRIEGEPMYYVHGAGFFAWGPRADSDYTLILWLTWPAYPPGW